MRIWIMVVAAILTWTAVQAGPSESHFGAHFGKNRVMGDSGIRGPAYSELVKYFSTLPTKYPHFAKVGTYGTSRQGRPLVVISISFPPAYRARHGVRPAILISGSTHGDEYLNIEDRLPEWFLKEGIYDPEIQPFFKLGGTIYVIPIFNPDGYDARRRENANGQDLNRDFKVKAAGVSGLKEVETRALHDFLTTQLRTQQQRLMLTMDYHCCIGAALYPWSFKKAPTVPADDLARFGQAARVIQSAFGAQFPVGRTPDILGYSAYGTSKDYYYESFGALGFTYEGEYKKEREKFPLHTQMWKGLIQAVSSSL